MFWSTFGLINLFHSVCKHRSTSFRQFGLLEGAQQLYFVLFPQESLFRDAGHIVHSSVLLVEMNCPLQIIKKFSTLDYNFATEAVFEKFIQTVHVLGIETECIQFL